MSIMGFENTCHNLGDPEGSLHEQCYSPAQERLEKGRLPHMEMQGTQNIKKKKRKKKKREKNIGKEEECWRHTFPDSNFMTKVQ